MGAKLRAIRRRRRAVTTTQQITRAMELIAASRIMRAQARALRVRPYSSAMTDLVGTVAAEAKDSPLLAEREVNRVGIIVVTSDRGLCGAYNSNVIREAERARTREQAAGHSVDITAVGKKGLSYYSFRRVSLAGEFTDLSDRPTFEDAQRVAAGVIERFVGAETDRVLIAYTDFVSMALQRARVVELLPPSSIEADRPEGPHAVFEFEPEPAELLDSLIPAYVEVKLFAALLESSASEHAARRRAMKDATDSATDLLKILKRDEDRARQAEITSEIADLVGAAEALKGA